MTKILVAECKQEVSSFNPVPSHYNDFAVLTGEAMFDHHRPLKDEVGGALSVLEREFETIPTYSARAITSGGTLAAADFERLADEFLNALRDAPACDAAYFALHGAMAAEQELDPEGFLLTEARKILGERMPFVISMDLHGILTDRMLELVDAVVVYHTYPHVDFYETGVRAGHVLRRILVENAKPVTARVVIPALVRGDELITASGAFGECIRMAQGFERQPHGLAAGMFIGNPFTDVPQLRTNSIAVTDNDAELAESQAVEMANTFWQHHEKMQVPLTPLPEAVSLARGVSGTVVMMDAADATSSGASGDSNAILRQLVEDGYGDSALIPLVDPPLVERAFSAGVGNSIESPVGGALDPERYEPLPMTLQVRMLSDGHFYSESFGMPWYSGRTAVLQAANITLVVGSRPVSLFDRAFFLAHGQDPQRFDLVVVKSPHCEPHMFADWCGKLINVDAPGSTSANLRSLGHKECARPIFPLDESVSFTPTVDIFRRNA